MKVYCSTCKTVHVFPCGGEVAGFAYKPVERPEWLPVAESLSRRLDALEKQAGPLGDDRRREKALARLELAIGMDAMRQLSLMDGGLALIQGWVAAGDQATATLAESIRAFMRSNGYEFKPFLTRFYATPASPDPTAAWRSDFDPKDALIRELMAFVRSNPDTRIASEYRRWGNKVDGFRDRAERLGVKL